MPLKIVIVSLLAFLASHYLTSVCVKYFPKLKLVDAPTTNRQHKLSTPTAGGVVISLLLFIFTILYSLYFSNPKVLYFLASLLILTTISFIDDFYDLSVLIRLPFQFLAAWLIILNLSPVIVPQLDFVPNYVMNILLLIGMVYFLNLYNFMDGIDGSASSEAIHISLSFILIYILFGINNPFSFFVAFVLCFSCLGFLFHNWSPAKIILGDAGSTSIGLICGWLMIILGKEGYLAAALIIPGYYLADSTITLINRMRKGERFWEPHTQHFFQIAAKSSNSHAKVTRKIIKYNVILCALALLSIFLPRISLIIAILVVSRLLIRFKKKGK